MNKKLYLVYEYNEIYEIRHHDLVGAYSSKDELNKTLKDNNITFMTKIGRFGEDAFVDKVGNTYQIYEVDLNQPFNNLSVSHEKALNDEDL